MLTHEEVENGVVLETDVHRFTAFASDIKEHGFEVGQWPTTVPTTLGNGRPFVRRTKHVEDGDIRWVTYRQEMGCLLLRVFND